MYACEGVCRADAAEEYPAPKNNSPWDGDEEKRGKIQRKSTFQGLDLEEPGELGHLKLAGALNHSCSFRFKGTPLKGFVSVSPAVSFLQDLLPTSPRYKPSILLVLQNFIFPHFLPRSSLLPHLSELVTLGRGSLVDSGLVVISVIIFYHPFSHSHPIYTISCNFWTWTWTFHLT